MNLTLIFESFSTKQTLFCHAITATTTDVTVDYHCDHYCNYLCDHIPKGISFLLLLGMLLSCSLCFMIKSDDHSLPAR